MRTMSKLNKRFEFNYPINETTKVNGLNMEIPIGEFRLEGVAYEHSAVPQLYDGHSEYGDRYEVDIDGIDWEGKDVTALIKSPICEEVYDRLKNAALRYIVDLFSPENLQDKIIAEQVDAVMQECA